MNKTIFAVTSVVLGMSTTPVKAQSFPTPTPVAPQVQSGSAIPSTQSVPNPNTPSNNVTSPFNAGPAPQPNMTINGQGNQQNPSFNGQGYDQYKNPSQPNTPKR